MAVLLSRSLLDSLAPQPIPAPDVTPRPQLGGGSQDGLQGKPQSPYGASYDEGYQPAMGGYSSAAGSPDPFSAGPVEDFSRAFNAQRILGTPLTDRAGIDTSQLPWWLQAGVRGATTPLSFMGGGGGAEGLITAAGAGAGQFIGSEGADRALPESTPPWLRTGVDTASGIAGALVGGSAANGVYRGAGAFDSAIAPRGSAPEYGRTPESDALFTAGPNGEVVGPTGNVAELRLGREPVMGEDVNAGLRRTAYGRAQQDALATEEQAAFRDAGERAISGAVPDQGVPPIVGGSGNRPQFTIDDLNAVIAEKKAAGLTPEQILADPQVQAYQREVFKLDAPTDFNAPENLGGGVGLTPEQQANVSGTVQRAEQLNTITDALAAAREPSALDSVIARNADTLPEPTRTQPPPGYLERFRQPPAGGSEVTSDPGMTPRFPGMEAAPDAAPTFGDHVRDVLSAPMSAKSTYDLSGPGRQLAPMLYAHPTAIKSVLTAQAKALRSAENFAASQEALRAKPYALFRDIAGVEMGGLTEGLAREEQIGSNLAQRILPKSVRFNDAYTAAINEGRDWLFKSMFDDIPASMLTEQGLREGGIAELQRIGKIVNASTGRGSILKVLTENKVLGQPLLWAPKLLAGRLQLPLEMFSESPIVRKEAARQVVSFVGTNLALLGMIKATGAADVELDPRSSDWGTIRIGQRRYDPWAGYKPLVNLIARLGVSAKNTVAAQVPSLGLATDTPNTKGITSANDVPGALSSRPALDVIANFLRSKLAPIPGEVWNQGTGKDITGADVTRAIADYGGSTVGRIEHATAGLLAPIFAESLAQELGYTVPEGYQQNGVPGALTELGKSAIGNVPWLGGAGGGYYQPRPQDYAAMGRYGELPAQDQLQAITAQTWQGLSAHPDLPKNLQALVQQYPSHYAWESALRDHYVKAYAEQGLTQANAQAMADRAVLQHPLQKPYSALKNGYEDRWVRANPQLAEQVLEEDAGKQPNERRLSVTNEQRNFIQQAIGGKR